MSHEKNPFSRLFPAGLALGNAERKVTFCQTSKRGTTSKWQARHIRCPSERHRTAMSHQPWLNLLKDSRTDCNRQNRRPILKAERWRSTLRSLPLMIGNLENWTAKSGKASIDFVERVLHQCIPQSPLPMIMFGGVNAFDLNQSGSQLKSDKQLRKTYLLDGGIGLFNAKEPTENLFAAIKMKTSCKFSWGVTKKTLTTFHYTGWLIGILIMAYYNPYIPGFSTFDLSARETSHTTGQHLSLYTWVV